MVSPVSSSRCPADKRPVVDLSPQSVCSSPSLSRLTYISMNDGTVLPTPDRHKVLYTKEHYTKLCHSTSLRSCDRTRSRELCLKCTPSSFLSQKFPIHQVGCRGRCRTVAQMCRFTSVSRNKDIEASFPVSKLNKGGGSLKRMSPCCLYGYTAGEIL